MPKTLGKTLIGDSNISFVDAALISVPNSTISNRAQIRNLAADMGPRMGVERIMTQQPYEIQNEFGPNGERVLGTLNDDRGLIRFVGFWSSSGISDQGQAIGTVTNGDFVEIVFFGTGLNGLARLNSNVYDLRATVDGGSEGGNLVPASYSAVLDGRKYSPNQIFPIVSGLSQGIHTVKLRNNQATNGQLLFGFEILNETATVRVNAGTLIRDQRRFGLDTAQTLPAKPAAYSGTRGARVVVYNTGNQILQAFTSVNATTLYLTSADHSNEDLIRTHHWREFGSARSDDFSTKTAAAGTDNRSFSLDDDTTNLIGNQLAYGSSQGYDAFYLATAGTSTISIYFTGTGLDIIHIDDATATQDAHTVTVDGVSAGTLRTTHVAGRQLREAIVSGLPYGTHIVKITRTNTGGADGMRFNKFFVYGPKKPTIPTGALELADYNVMADFVANAAAGVDNIATGILRKNTIREGVYVGSGWAANFQTNGSRIGGTLANQSGSSGGYVEYTFFGTGFEHRGQANTTYPANITLTLNGTALTSTNFASATFSTVGGYSYTAGTGTLAQNVSNTNGSGLRVSGLPLAKYTLRMTNNTTAEFQNEALDIITPIHSPRANSPADIMNTLPIGNCALSDSRQLIRADFGQNKYRGYAVGITSSPTTTSTSYIPAPDLSLTVNSRGGQFDISYSMATLAPAGGNVYGLIYVNGVAQGQDKLNGGGSAFFLTLADRINVYLPPGVHKVDIFWKVDAGTGTLSSTRRNLTVEEL